ncbi:hypothetical protein J2Y45_002519 [Dyadobacter sp. BE34]|uniref:Glycosyltransferase RgtA/B/C/D-like domain-containing protein n=1 Tax=Dyadobacter fermentans TaxID=94254 RepID=A0ABU1QVJ3_9BACT|nr:MULTISPECIES: hypothetical protein [Dyadobacter]MDR6805173.1 hypothetical protein [Dyadobacter fermentans]MDR7043068.1 hypothetical protein [Dyadobacter sp. BE242]MDR7197380.1 hypothetical protein [Dyadobacter sp. BE34]MDR7215187.1 hypothetical protein [Dyadobacter sp. BE31]MDR7262722.1 hypothetical protein [Dyadobacter sp. BE32]
MSTRNILALLATLLLIAAARLYLVETYAIPLPFWDQWDAEGDHLLRPWIEGRLHIDYLWDPHNEHRILPTRLLSLLIFNITGVWDNLIEARVNILVAACIPLIFLLFLMRQKALYGARWLVLIAIIAQFALPFAFENVLVGFQSQFYFLITFTLLAIILAALYPDSLLAMAGVLVLSWLSVLTMASGIFTPLAAAGVYALQGFQKREINGKHVGLAVVLVGLAIIGYSIMPQIEANHIYRARNLSDMRKALRFILAWPVSKSWPAAIVLWIPGLAMVPWLLRNRTLSCADLFMAGCVIWSLAQTLAIAYGRGQEMGGVSSRHSELFTPGLIGNAWFAARFIEVTFKNKRITWLGAVFFIVFIMGHITRRKRDMLAVHQTYDLSMKQETNVRKYLKTGNPAVLVQPQFEIPYPDSIRLRSLLDNPTIRPILPPYLSRD